MCGLTQRHVILTKPLTLTYKSPVSVDKYVDYLYFLADAHSVHLMQMNYKKFLFASRLFKLKQVQNLVTEKAAKPMAKPTLSDYISMPRCVWCIAYHVMVQRFYNFLTRIH